MDYILSHAEAPRTQDQLLQGFTQLLAPVGVDKWVDERVADDENKEKVKVSKEAVAERTGGAGEDEDEVEEERTPAYNEDPEQDGQGNRPLHARGLAPAFVECNNAPGMYVRQDEHM